MPKYLMLVVMRMGLSFCNVAFIRSLLMVRVQLLTDRCTAEFLIFEYDADISIATPIGQTQSTYIRYPGTSGTIHPVFENGELEIEEDNTAVKLIAVNGLPDAGQSGGNNGQFTLEAGMTLKLYRTGMKGEPGEVGEGVEEISEANITDENSEVVGGISGRRAKAAVEEFAPEEADSFHLTVDRNYVTGTPNAANDITIVLHSGTVYNVGVSRYTGAEALPDTYLRALPTGTEIRLVDGDIVWLGELVSVHDVLDTSATLRIDFTDRTGLLSDFSVNDNVEISFGYSPAQVPVAGEILIEGELDGNLADSDQDVEAAIQEIDNLDLGGDGDFVSAGDDISISGVGTETDPKEITK